MPPPAGYVVQTGTYEWSETETTTSEFSIDTIATIPPGDYGTNPCWFAGVTLRYISTESGAECDASVGSMTPAARLINFSDGGSHIAAEPYSALWSGGTGITSFYCADPRINDGCDVQVRLTALPDYASITGWGIMAWELLQDVPATPVFPGTPFTFPGNPTISIGIDLAANSHTSTATFGDNPAVLSLEFDPREYLTCWAYGSNRNTAPSLSVESETDWYYVVGANHSTKDLYTRIGFHAPSASPNYLDVEVAGSQGSTLYSAWPECVSSPTLVPGGQHQAMAAPRIQPIAVRKRNRVQVIG